jgi:hypothetical protein
MSIEMPDYYLTVSGISNHLSMHEYDIGFYNEVELSVNTGIFVDGFELSLGGDKGFLSAELVPYYTYNGYGLNGYESATMTIGVKDSAYETCGYAVIECDDDDIYRAPVVNYELAEYTASLTVNSGVSLEVESGKVSGPIAVCTTAIPVSEHTFTIEVLATDEAEDPEISTDVTEITLSSNNLCAYIVIIGNSTEATAERTASITITPSASDMCYNSYSGSITVVAATTTSLSLSIELTDMDTHSVGFAVTASRRSLVILYLAPLAHYKVYSDMSDSEAEDFLSWVQFISPESRVLAGVYTDTTLEWEADDLLRGVQYKYAAIAQGAEGEYYSIRSDFTMSSGEILAQAVTYNMSIVGNLTDEEKLDLVCDLPDYYALPHEDISTLDGQVCYEPYDYTDEEWLATLGAGGSTGGDDVTSSSSDGSEAAIRLLQDTYSDYSDVVVDDTIVTAVEYLILPPIRSWVVDYVSEPDDAATLLAGLTEYLEDEWEIKDIAEPEFVDIMDVDSVSTGSVSTTQTSLTLSNAQLLDAAGASVTGSICYAVFAGDVTTDIVSIKTGNLDGTDAIEYTCQYLEVGEGLTFTVNGLTADTSYTIGMYGRTIDPREYAQTTGTAENVDARTSAASTPTEEEEEEEYGLVSSIGFLALLLALFFNF